MFGKGLNVEREFIGIRVSMVKENFPVVEFDNQIKFNKELKVIRGPPYNLNETQ